MTRQCLPQLTTCPKCTARRDDSHCPPPTPRPAQHPTQARLGLTDDRAFAHQHAHHHPEALLGVAYVYEWCTARRVLGAWVPTTARRGWLSLLLGETGMGYGTSYL